MDIEPAFNTGDIVKLKKNLKDTNLKTGDFGIVWAVYQYLSEKNNKVQEFDYEATFWDSRGNDMDSKFEESDAEKVLKIEDVPFSESMKELWLYLNQK